MKEPAITRIVRDGRRWAAALRRPARDADESEVVLLTLQSVGSWAHRHLDAAAIDANGTLGQEVYRSAAALGLFGLTAPEQWGGSGLSLTATARVIEEIAVHDRSAATAIGLHCGLGLRGLIELGSPLLKDRYLPSLALGSWIAAFAATESEAGSHIAAARSLARWDGGSRLVLSGSKSFVTNGGVAEIFTVLARTPGLAGARRGFSLLLLTRQMPGLSVGAEEHKLGLRGTSTTTLSFDDVELGLDHVIGEASRGLDLMHGVLAWGRTLMAAGCIGTARRAYQLALRHVQERRQFGRPIALFGLVREKIADMRAALFGVESVVRLTTLLHDHGGGDIAWESAQAKVLASERSWQIIDTALQLHGGAGYIEATGLPLLLRDSRITRIFEGANDVLRFNIAMELLGTDLGSWSASLAPMVCDELTPVARHFDALAERVHRVGAGLRDRFGVRIGERQILLGRIADAVGGLYLQLAMILRAEGELAADGGAGEAGGAGGAEALLELTSYACAREALAVEQSLRALERSGAGQEELALKVSAAAYRDQTPGLWRT